MINQEIHSGMALFQKLKDAQGQSLVSNEFLTLANKSDLLRGMIWAYEHAIQNQNADPIKISLEYPSGATYDSSNNVMTVGRELLNNPSQLLQSFAHELQHFIDDPLFDDVSNTIRGVVGAKADYVRTMLYFEVRAAITNFLVKKESGDPSGDFNGSSSLYARILVESLKSRPAGFISVDVVNAIAREVMVREKTSNTGELYVDYYSKDFDSAPAHSPPQSPSPIGWDPVGKFMDLAPPDSSVQILADENGTLTVQILDSDNIPFGTATVTHSSDGSVTSHWTTTDGANGSDYLNPDSSYGEFRENADGGTYTKTILVNGDWSSIEVDPDGSTVNMQVTAGEAHNEYVNADGSYRETVTSLDGPVTSRSYSTGGELLDETIVGIDGSSIEKRFNEGSLITEKNNHPDGSFSLKEYFSDGTLRTSATTNTDGSGNGVSYYPNGSIYASGTWSADFSSSLISYSESGTVTEERTVNSDGSFEIVQYDSYGAGGTLRVIHSTIGYADGSLLDTFLSGRIVKTNIDGSKTVISGSPILEEDPSHTETIANDDGTTTTRYYATNGSGNPPLLSREVTVLSDGSETVVRHYLDGNHSGDVKISGTYVNRSFSSDENGSTVITYYHGNGQPSRRIVEYSFGFTKEAVYNASGQLIESYADGVLTSEEFYVEATIGHTGGGTKNNSWAADESGATGEISYYANGVIATYYDGVGEVIENYASGASKFSRYVSDDSESIYYYSSAGVLLKATTIIGEQSERVTKETTYDANGNASKTVVTYENGSVITTNYGIDGTEYGTRSNADGSYSTFTSDVLGSVKTVNFNAGGNITDVVYASSDHVLNGNRLFLNLTGEGNINGVGNALDNDINGNEGNNSILGLAGNDVIAGNAGNDTLDGGEGNDHLNGGFGNDLLVGGLGDDFLYGGDTAGGYGGYGGDLPVEGDTLIGGAGNDFYIVNDYLDAVIEGADEGVDSVQADISYTLASNVENLTLAGSGAINGTGNELSNILEGNSGSNVLEGGAGNDTYVFKLGGGNDVIVDIDNAPDNADTIRLGEGIFASDVVFARDGDDLQLSINGTVDRISVKNWWSGDANRIERVEFFDGTVLQASDIQQMIPNENGVESFGTDNDDWMTGTDYSDSLHGLAGSDIIIGNSGDDTLNGGAGSDYLIGGSEADTYIVEGNFAGDIDGIYDIGQSGQDVAQGVAGNDYAAIDALVAAGTIHADRILFGPNVTAGDLVISGGTGTGTVSLRLANGSGVDIQLASADDFAGTGIELIEFGNGSYLTIGQIMSIADVDHELTGTSDDEIFNVGGGNDLIFGGAGSDEISGGAGNDLLFGEDDDDFVEDYGGRNVLDAGAGDDYLGGDGGPSFIVGGQGNDEIESYGANSVVAFNAGHGYDALYVGNALTISLGNGILAENLSLAIDGNDVVIQLNGEDVISLTSFIEDYTSSDRPSVKLQFVGNDIQTYDFNAVLADFETAIAQGASSSNWSAASSLLVHSLATSVDQVIGGEVAYRYAKDNNLLALSNDQIRTIIADSSFGQTAQTVQMDDISNNLLGTDANDLLNGTEGADTLLGGMGNDTLAGGGGNDTYMINVGDGVDTITDDGGVDTIQFGASITQEDLSLGIGSLLVRYGGEENALHIEGFNPANALGTSVVENFRFADGSTLTYEQLLTRGFDLAGSGSIVGTSVNDRISGSEIQDTIDAGQGNDTLDGSLGADTMIGGAGNDIYAADNAGDIVLENAGEGIDLVTSSVDYQLTDNVEALALSNAAIIGYGNSSDNLIKGNSNSNILYGLEGNDILQGGNGADALTDAIGNNLFDGGVGNDTLTSGDGNSFLAGGLGNDTINTGSGADIIAINFGNGVDTISVSSGTDTLSLGKGVTYSGLAFSKSANDLIFNLSPTGVVILKDWYAANNGNHIDNLQILIEGTPDFNSASNSQLNNKKVQLFDFEGLVGKFDEARAAAPYLTSWALSSALLEFHIGGSDTAAIGGDLAYQYAKNGNLSSLSMVPTQGLLGDASFGATTQNLQSTSALQDLSPKLF